MILAEEIVVTITYSRTDDNAPTTYQRLEDMAQQTGVVADSGNGERGPRFPMDEGGEWSWKFTGSPSTLQAFLRLVESYCK
jgi:hypothetical protein